MNNSQVAHKWANGHDAKGSNFYAENGTIYSYGPHFPIARLCEGHILFTTSSYSNSTSKHISLVRYAIANDATVIRIPSLRESVGTNEQMICVGLQEMLRKHAKSRVYKDYIAIQIQKSVANLSLYLKTYKTKPSKETKALLKLIASGEWAKVKELDAKQQKARDKAQALRAKKQAELAEKLHKELIEKRDRWIAGETVEFYGTNDYGQSYLRVKDRMVQTSRGAEIPLRPAMRLFELAKKCRETGQPFSEAITFDSFTLRQISAFGNVEIGCHHLEFDEMARIAPLVELALV